MSYVTETLSNLIHQTAFFNLTWGNYLMIAVACVFLIPCYQEGIRAASACSYRIRYAACKYLSGHYGKPGRYVQWCRRTSSLFLHP